MSDKFTEVTQTGFFSRLAGSFAGLLIGPLLVIGAIILLSWNEGRAVQAIVGLGQASSAVVEASPNSVSPANDTKLVHVIGTATAQAPIQDSDMGLNFPGQIAVSRNAEMYQWREHEESKTEDQLGGGQKTVTTYTYTEEWASTASDSSNFKHPEGHQNPAMKFASHDFAASDAKLGAYTLGGDTIGLLQPANALTPDAPAGWNASGGELYNGNATAPKVGDMRVAYKALPSGTTVSVMAEQSAGGFAPFVTPNGYQIHLASTGNQPAAVMIAAKKSAESTLTWILRGVGALLIFIGISAFLGPLATFGAVIPFLGSVMRGAIMGIALVITLPLTLIVIAIAWIAFRPLIGGGLLILAIAALYGLARWHRSRNLQPKPA